MIGTRLAIRRRTAFALAITLGLIVLADWLFYGRPIGWTASLYGFALLTAVTLRDGRWLKGWAGRVIAAGLLGLGLAIVIEPGPLPVTLGLLGLVTLAMIDRDGWTHRAGELAWRWVRFIGRGVVQPIRDARLIQRWRRSHRGAGPSMRWALAWALPIAGSAVFVGLFAIANPVLARWLHTGWSSVSNWFSRLPDFIAPARIGLWLLAGFGAWALLRVRVGRCEGLRAYIGGHPVCGGWGQTLPTATAISPGVLVRCLVLFNGVFLLQNALDGYYLFGHGTLPEGMTYARYAHRGAYPLVATALLAGAFVLVGFRHGGPASRSAWARRLVGLWIAQNVVLMATAAYRLGLYIQVYSLTRWRVAAGIWMALVALGLVLLVWRVIADRDNRWLLQRVAVLAAAVLYACCFVNFDGAIAAYNVAHCAEMDGEGPPIDLAYLEQLGPAALPAVQRLVRRLDDRAHPDLVAGARQQATHTRAELRDELADWRGWTWRRSTLRQTIADASP